MMHVGCEHKHLLTSYQVEEGPVDLILQASNAQSHRQPTGAIGAAVEISCTGPNRQEDGGAIRREDRTANGGQSSRLSIRSATKISAISPHQGHDLEHLTRCQPRWGDR